MNSSKTLVVLAAISLAQWGVATGSVQAGPVFFGPTPYLSAADIPAGFYLGGAPDGLEDFEDASLDFGIAASVGAPFGPGDIADSVDADDGTIDGFGNLGRTWFSGGGPAGITFTFPSLVTAAGIVWTDGAGTTTVEAFGPGMVSLGTVGPVAIADGDITGATAEDRFFGAQDPNGILAIKLSNTSGGIEVDHVQFGSAPDPAAVPTLPKWGTLVLLILLIGSAVRVVRRSPARSAFESRQAMRSRRATNSPA